MTVCLGEIRPLTPSPAPFCPSPGLFPTRGEELPPSRGEEPPARRSGGRGVVARVGKQVTNRSLPGRMTLDRAVQSSQAAWSVRADRSYTGGTTMAVAYFGQWPKVEGRDSADVSQQVCNRSTPNSVHSHHRAESSTPRARPRTVAGGCSTSGRRTRIRRTSTGKSWSRSWRPPASARGMCSGSRSPGTAPRWARLPEPEAIRGGGPRHARHRPPPVPRIDHRTSAVSTLSPNEDGDWRIADHVHHPERFIRRQVSSPRAQPVSPGAVPQTEPALHRIDAACVYARWEPTSPTSMPRGSHAPFAPYALPCEVPKVCR